MFSKYSSIEIPQNYSGSRFKRSYELHTETKTHTPSEHGAVKSSVSPAYQEQIDAYMENESIDKTENDYLEQNDDFSVESVETNEDEKSDPVDKNVQESCNNESCKLDSKRFGFDELLKSFSSEDLLLVCLIIFLSTDGSISNNDIIILLSLLLAYHI